MDIHKPKPWHGWREFLKEYGIIVLGVLTALALEQAVEALRWAHETADARQMLGREISADVRALKLIGAQDACINQRLEALQLWAQGAGPKPAGTLLRPMYYTLQTSGWDVVNSGQAVAHFPLEQKLKYAVLYASLDNERATIGEERDAWQTAVAIAGDQQSLDDADRRELRHALGLALTIAHRRRGNARVIIEESAPLAVEGPAPSYLKGSPDDASQFCRSLATAMG
ncbi:MAG TPA: hypothetical protein VG248_07110 [Caulobacteraceae bacterium]|nr:hypothetical protein [Caulobacteraceae bacterium]